MNKAEKITRSLGVNTVKMATGTLRFANWLALKQGARVINETSNVISAGLDVLENTVERKLGKQNKEKLAFMKAYAEKHGIDQAFQGCLRGEVDVHDWLATEFKSYGEYLEFAREAEAEMKRTMEEYFASKQNPRTA